MNEHYRSMLIGRTGKVRKLECFKLQWGRGGENKGNVCKRVEPKVAQLIQWFWSHLRRDFGEKIKIQKDILKTCKTEQNCCWESGIKENIGNTTAILGNA